MKTYVHFNPSTLKVGYNNSSGKVLVYDSCPGCVSSGTFTLTFSGITECSSPAEPFPSSPNITFELTYYGYCSSLYTHTFFGQSGDWMVTMACYTPDHKWYIYLYYIVDDEYYIAYSDSQIEDPCKDGSENVLDSSNYCGYYVGLYDRCTSLPGTPGGPLVTGYGGSCDIKYAA